MSQPDPKPTLTVAGVTFTADQVQSATLKIEGREVTIGKPIEPEKQIGFKATP